MRRLLAGLGIWLILSATACSVPVEVPVFEGGEGLGFFEQAARDYNTSQARFQVNVYGDPRISEKLRIRLLEESDPEVSNANLNYWKLIELGRIKDVAPELERGWGQRFLPGTLEPFHQKGHYYGVPFILTVHVVWYNKKLFREHGWQPPKTWEAWQHLCERVQKETNNSVAPLAFQGRYSFYAQPLLEHLFYQWGGKAGYARLKSWDPQVFSEPWCERSLGAVQKMTRFFGPGWQGMSHTEAQMAFFQGKAAMVVCGSWLKGEMAGNIPADFELGQFALPPPSDGLQSQHSLYVSSAYYFVFSHSGQPEGGVEFLKHLTSPQVAQEFVRQRDIPLALRGVNHCLSSDLQDLARIIESSDDCYGELAGPTLMGASQIWADLRGGLLNGRLTPKQAAELLRTGAEQARSPQGASANWRPWAVMWLAGLGLAVVANLRRQAASSGQVRWQSWSLGTTLLFVAGPMLCYAVFFLLPSLVAIAGASYQWDGLGPPKFIGLENYNQLLGGVPFWRALANNLWLAVVPALITLPCALGLAAGLASYSGPKRGYLWRFWRTIFFLPNLMGVAGILLWQQLYNPSGGPLNSLLVGLGWKGMANFSWLSSENLYWALVPMSVWTGAGFFMVLLLAAMDNVPRDYYDSATLEGANSWQILRHITLPSIRPTLAVCMIFLLSGGLKAFEGVWLLTNQAPTSNDHVLGTLLLQESFQNFQLGRAQALGVLLLTVSLLVSLWAARWQEDAHS